MLLDARVLVVNEIVEFLFEVFVRAITNVVFELETALTVVFRRVRKVEEVHFLLQTLRRQRAKVLHDLARAQVRTVDALRGSVMDPGV